MGCQPSLLTLHLPAASVSLLLRMEFMPILLSFAFLLLGGGFQLGLHLLCCSFRGASRQYFDMSHFPTIIAHWSSLLTNIL